MLHTNESAPVVAQEKSTFGDDRSFLKSHTEIIELSAGENQKVLVAPDWQGRVMTSTCDGNSGQSFGWVNNEAVKKGILPPDQRQGLDKHIHVFGGEERFWLGPEGGQYSLFFSPNAQKYEFEFWQTPAILDTMPFDVISKSPTSVKFRKDGRLTNKAGTELHFRIDRSVSLLNKDELSQLVGTGIDDSVNYVAFQSSNCLTNTGGKSWKPDKGLPSIWLLGMLKPGEDVVMAVPIITDASGPEVNTDYFGEVESDRLKVEQGVAYFKGDGKFRSKIGIPGKRAKPICGSYSPSQKTLTILHFNLPEDAAELPYVCSQWRHHTHPYSGDVVNCYNDGAPAPGQAPLGPFYELESSSPALALLPNGSYTHVQTTAHFTGPPEALNKIAKATLGVELDTIAGAFDE